MASTTKQYKLNSHVVKHSITIQLYYWRFKIYSNPYVINVRQSKYEITGIEKIVKKGNCIRLKTVQYENKWLTRFEFESNKNTF